VEGGGIRQYRLDRITTAQLEPESFQRDPDFDLTRHAARAFGSFQNEEEYGEVIWQFSPTAAQVAQSFVFHPDQELTELADGSLEVRFHASGHLEMAWHLYQWGDQVEVISPESLREMVKNHRRGDFPALP
jgi:predicted DNA-binding transcriptional regulator YafY